MEQNIADYVFYMITKEYPCWKSEGFTLGIKRLPNCVLHSVYFEWLKDTELVFFEGISSDWGTGLEQLTKDGNILIANTAIEIEEVEKRLYIIFLPSFVSRFQLEELQKHINEIEALDIIVDVEGENRANFLRKIVDKDYKPIEFLKSYLHLYEEKKEDFTKIEKGIQKIKY